MPEVGQKDDPSPPANSDATADVPRNYETCDRTGFRVLPGELQREWDGKYVRPESWEPRQMQDLVRARSERQNGAIRPEQNDSFLNTIASGSLTALTNQPAAEDY